MKLQNRDECLPDDEERRLHETQALTELAYKTADPILLMSCELDLLARQKGYHIEYDEEYDDSI